MQIYIYFKILGYKNTLFFYRFKFFIPLKLIQRSHSTSNSLKKTKAKAQ